MTALVEFCRDLMLEVPKTSFFQGLGLEICGLLIVVLGISLFRRIKF